MSSYSKCANFKLHSIRKSVVSLDCKPSRVHVSISPILWCITLCKINTNMHTNATETLTSIFYFISFNPMRTNPLLVKSSATTFIEPIQDIVRMAVILKRLDFNTNATETLTFILCFISFNPLKTNFWLVKENATSFEEPIEDIVKLFEMLKWLDFKIFKRSFPIDSPNVYVMELTDQKKKGLFQLTPQMCMSWC